VGVLVAAVDSGGDELLLVSQSLVGGHDLVLEAAHKPGPAIRQQARHRHRRCRHCHHHRRRYRTLEGA